MNNECVQSRCEGGVHPDRNTSYSNGWTGNGGGVEGGWVQLIYAVSKTALSSYIREEEEEEEDDKEEGGSEAVRRRWWRCVERRECIVVVE